MIMTRQEPAAERAVPEAEALRHLHGWVDSVEPEHRRFALRTGGRRVTVRCDAPDFQGPFDALRSECVVRVDTAHPVDGEDDEVPCVRLEVLNSSQSLPFRPAQRADVSAGLRSRFRYLEFRDPQVQRLLRLRHGVQHAISGFLHDRGFISVETPILATPSGSGANEFRVSSSRSEGTRYALPQSPQVYGHLLVLGGVEAYYQWARCFRDEDLRTNRQPEFTQLHVEVAFAGRDELMSLLEGAVQAGIAAAGRTVTGGVSHLQYDDAMRRFGVDKPDLRCAPEVRQLPYRLADGRDGDTLIQVRLPEWVVVEPRHVEGLRQAARAARVRFLGFLPDRPRPLGWLRQTVETSELQALSPEPRAPYAMLWAGPQRKLDALHLELYRWVTASFTPPEDELRLAWVTDFPLFARSEEGTGLQAFGHPFTRPRDAEAFERARRQADFLALKGQAFDLVLNGEEIGSGSMLIERLEVQLRVLRTLGVTSREVRQSYGFLLDAMRCGAPPIGGFGMGLDRFVAKLSGVEKIRDVIAFPKTKQGYCPVTHRPA